jgi:uncharacterized protein HemX
MADQQHQPSASAGGGLLSAAVLGALAGAGGFAWWLWRHSRNRSAASQPPLALDRPAAESRPLPDRVQQLNQAIEEVRRQLESLQSQP